MLVCKGEQSLQCNSNGDNFIYDSCFHYRVTYPA